MPSQEGATLAASHASLHGWREGLAETRAALPGKAAERCCAHRPDTSAQMQSAQAAASLQPCSRQRRAAEQTIFAQPAQAGS